jgi:hypothetical protein
MFETRRRAFVWLMLTLAPLTLLFTGSAVAQGRMREYRSKYYVIYSDLDRNAVREAEQRINHVAELYHERTKGFAGAIRQRLPFYLFRRPQDYFAAGGLPGSGGMFDGERLMIIAGDNLTPETWRLIQHEGFHQFVHAVIGGNFPTWVNEGLAEYFGDAEFTGEGYVTGVIPPRRLQRFRLWLSEGHTISIREMMQMPHEVWNARLSVVNYDQAWSMVYFLAHAENGRYQRPFNGFIRDVSRGLPWEQAWLNNFGSGTRAFEQKWLAYWKQMPENPTEDLYARATAAKLTSFYARAFSQRQIFKTMDGFLAAARAGSLKMGKDDWLPRSLMQEALREMDQYGRWSIRKRLGYEVVCTRPDGTELVGTFKVRRRRVKDVDVELRN